jgi:hypothetical protein
VSTTLVMAAVVAAARAIMPDSWPALARLVTASSLGAAAYLGAAWLWHGPRIRGLIGMLRATRG